MLRIENTNKLVGESFVVSSPTGLIIWNVVGVHNYGPDGVYQIHLMTTSPQNDKVFILTEEEGFMEGNANYKITDSDDTSKSVWVNYSNISNITSMLRTLKRIMSHANN
jgi:hypothetical protein